MKKWIGWAVCLALCLMAASAPADTTLMVVSDLHYITPEYYEGTDLLERSAQQGDGKVPHRSDMLLSLLRDAVLAARPDVLILAGDQSYNGEVLSHRNISDMLAQLAAEGILILAIPGNHDINNSNAFDYSQQPAEAVHSIPVERYEKYYGGYGLAQAFSRDDTSFSYAVKVTDALWVVMLDACIFEPFAEIYGLVEPSTLDWLSGVLAQAQAEDAQVITVSHQSLLSHSDVISNVGYMVINAEDVLSLLQIYGVRLHISGHVHVQDIAQADGVTEVSQGSFALYPHDVGFVTVREDGTMSYRTDTPDMSTSYDTFLRESEMFFLQVTENKVQNDLRNVVLPLCTLESMKAYAAKLNNLYYGGNVYHQLQALDIKAYEAWAEHGQDLFWWEYIQSMEKSGEKDASFVLIGPK